MILASAAKKREIVESLFSGNLAVANRVLEQAVAWQTERGRMRLAMKLVIKILESLLQGPRPPNPLKSNDSAGAESNSSKLSKTRYVSFIIGAVGGSRTAGHGGWYNDSWPMVLGKELEGPLGAVGVNVDVRNRAAGFGGGPGFSFETAAFCLDATLGPGNVDLLLFEFNTEDERLDGATPTTTAPSGPRCCVPQKAEHFEAFIRNALSLPGHPVLLQHFGFGDEERDGGIIVPEYRDVSNNENTNFLQGRAISCDLEYNRVLVKYRRDDGSFFNKWVRINDLKRVPAKKTGMYRPSPPEYWEAPEGANLVEKYGDFGIHWFDHEGITHEVGHHREFWKLNLYQRDVSAVSF